MPSSSIRFGRQERARRDSWVLVAGFVLALGTMAAVTHVAVVALSAAFGGSAALLEPNGLAVAAIALLWATVLLGAGFRWLDVRAGGAALASRFGAVPVSDADSDARARRLTAMVAEMAIAAGCPPPGVHLLRRASDIDAFVVGTRERAAIVVSQGALDALERDELRGVVAHEIAHVAHGDLALDMRLLVVLGGLLALDTVGRTLSGEPPAPGTRRPVHPALFVGGSLRALGSVGVLCASLVRAALSRRRELLADAAAARLTRQPFALASALATIRDAGGAAVPRSAHAQELAHLRFHAGEHRRRFRRLLAGHPPLQTRIDALDPHTDVKRRERRQHRRERETPSVGANAAAALDGESRAA